MAELGPEEGRALCEALEGPAPTSVRLHPQRPCRWSGAEAVPWSPAGRYLTERPSFTLDPAFHAGAYYVQEASSQFLAHVLAGEEVAGKRILDLCAAPGGKTTLYASLAGSDGLVVANEVNRQRAAVLADNVRKWGLGNVAVTVNEPAQIAVLEGWFDIVAVDAPCSGEGMFRKIPEARDEWSENNVKICAVRQAEILREAWKTLRPGGLLIYSTCTFNRLENEGSLEGLLAEAGEEIVESTAFDCPPAWGVVCGRVGPFRTFRFYPHRTRGEGFFAAVARKVSDGGSRVRVPKSRRTIFAPAGRRECAELSRWVAEPERMRFAAVADVYYAYYESQYEAVKMLAESLRVIASGVAMGQIFKERLKPDHALAMFCGLDRGAVPVAELSEEEALRFLRKQEAEAYRSIVDTLIPVIGGTDFDATEENIQSRIRTLMLMALQNKNGYVLLNCSNKSENALGICTLYGDTGGAFSVTGDLYKTEMYDLARYINRKFGAPIPENILTKEPSSELRPNQKDSDMLPSYEVVDAILYRLIEDGQSREEIINAGFDSDEVQKIYAMVMRNEKKRFQYPPVLRLSSSSFGHEYRMPLTHKYVK